MLKEKAGSNFEVQNKPELELSKKEKAQMIDIWQSIVLGKEKASSKAASELSNEDLINWLYGSLMEEVDDIVQEWHILEGLYEIIDKMNNATDMGSKVKYEKLLCKAIRGKLKIFDETQDKLKESNGEKKTSDKYDSWPLNMRENKQFNCVGATLVGMSILNKLGIKNYLGNPASHIVNIVRLSDGRLMYTDLRNDNQIVVIDPEHIKIAGGEVLRISEERLDYRLIPVSKNSDIAGSILGNLDCPLHDAERDDLSDDDLDKIEAKKLVDKYGEMLKGKHFWDDFVARLFPKKYAVSQAKDIEDEKDRVRELHEEFAREKKILIEKI
jgi:hypothetical protein